MVVVVGKGYFFFFYQVGCVCIIGDLLGQCCLEIGQMGVVIVLGNVVGEIQYLFVIVVVLLYCCFYGDVVVFGMYVDWFFDQWVFGLVKVVYEGFQFVFVEKFFDYIFNVVFVCQDDLDVGIQECQFLQVVFQGVEVEFGFGEGFW